METPGWMLPRTLGSNLCVQSGLASYRAEYSLTHFLIIHSFAHPSFLSLAQAGPFPKPPTDVQHSLHWLCGQQGQGQLHNLFGVGMNEKMPILSTQEKLPDGITLFIDM